MNNSQNSTQINHHLWEKLQQISQSNNQLIQDKQILQQKFVLLQQKFQKLEKNMMEEI